MEQRIYSIGIQNFESLRQDGYHFNFKTPGIYNRGEWAARHAKGKPFISKCRGIGQKRMGEGGNSCFEERGTASKCTLLELLM